MLTPEENIFYNHFLQLKKEAGNHSPSIFKLLKSFPEVSIRVDACFLCNPYAFNLFYEEFQQADLQKYVKFYPPTNSEVAENIAAFRNIPSERILVGNGAIELIEKILSRLHQKRIILTLPTFSSYYESVDSTNTILPYHLSAENCFKIDAENFGNFAKNAAEYVIIVNPNNPTGTLLSYDEIVLIHKKLANWQTLIVDESFIDFSDSNNSVEKYSLEHDNIIVLRSLSKDFGIAGLRLGYAVMPENMVKSYLEQGFLWNTNGIAYYFTELLANTSFQKRYAKAKRDYNNARDDFYQELINIGVDVVPSHANFFMIRTPHDPGIYFSKLLYTHGIYTRILNDKWGLEGNWLRIASKDRKENRQMLYAIKKIWTEINTKINKI